MSSTEIVLRSPLRPDEDSWVFTLDTPLPPARRGQGKLLRFSPEHLTLQLSEFPSNRVLNRDSADEFILASFGALRFKDNPPSAVADYIKRVLTSGFFLNGKQYRFYHHSNSQLRSRSCWLRVANTDEELDRRIVEMCDVSKINNIAKRECPMSQWLDVLIPGVSSGYIGAKRIGLLFSGAEIDWDLDPKFTKDISDITLGEELFSDGMSYTVSKDDLGSRTLNPIRLWTNFNAIDAAPS